MYSPALCEVSMVMTTDRAGSLPVEHLAPLDFTNVIRQSESNSDSEPCHGGRDVISVVFVNKITLFFMVIMRR